MEYKKRKRGFTLVELIVVIAIIGILAAISVPKYSAYKENAAKKADEATAKLLTQATLMAIDNNADVQAIVKTVIDDTVTNANIATWKIIADKTESNTLQWDNVVKYMGKGVQVNRKGVYPYTWTINIAKSGTIITIKAELTDSTGTPQILATYSMEY